MKSSKVEIVLLVVVLVVTVAANQAPLAYGAKTEFAYWYPPIYPKSAGTFDGSVLELSENANVGGSVNATGAVIKIGDDVAKRQSVAILHFNTASYSIPPTAVIASAVIKIRRQAIGGINPFLSFGALNVDMRKPYFGTSALTPSDFQVTAGRAVVATFARTPVNGWYKAKLNATGRIYLNKRGPTQFRLYFKLGDNNNAVADFVGIYSGNAASALRPVLEIEYYVP
ncbi:MAG: hypothetical protein HY867_07530 [Chloroflexi bacterium]|nr:hypothetical protein [Chloroflexota bacterium]